MEPSVFSSDGAHNLDALLAEGSSLDSEGVLTHRYNHLTRNATRKHPLTSTRLSALRLQEGEGSYSGFREGEAHNLDALLSEGGLLDGEGVFEARLLLLCLAPALLVDSSHGRQNLRSQRPNVTYCVWPPHSAIEPQGPCSLTVTLGVTVREQGHPVTARVCNRNTPGRLTQGAGFRVEGPGFRPWPS